MFGEIARSFYGSCPKHSGSAVVTKFRRTFALRLSPDQMGLSISLCLSYRHSHSGQSAEMACHAGFDMALFWALKYCRQYSSNLFCSKILVLCNQRSPLFCWHVFVAGETSTSFWSSLAHNVRGASWCLQRRSLDGIKVGIMSTELPSPTYVTLRFHKFLTQDQKRRIPPPPK